MTIDPLILARIVHFAATLLAGGTVSFMVLVAEPALAPADWPPLRRRLTVLVWLALAVVLASGVCWWLLLAAQIDGTSIAEVCLNGGAWQVATDTRFGWVWGARAVLAVLLGVLVLWPAARWLQVAAGAGLVALLGLIGHAGATPGLAGRAHLVVDMVHLLAAAGWLGALPGLWLLLQQTSHAQSAGAAAAKRFSPVGFVCVGALMASGAFDSWRLLAGPRDLVTTGYGLLVLLKIGLFAAMVGIAAVNKYRVTPQLPAPAAVHSLRCNILAETALGLCVLLSVGVLGTLTPTAHVHTTSSVVPPDAAFVHIHSTEAMADVTIDPGHFGIVKAEVRVSREDFVQFAAKEVRLALDPLSTDLKAVASATRRMPDGTWQAENLFIPQRGIWTVRVTVVPETGGPIVLDAPIVIE